MGASRFRAGVLGHPIGHSRSPALHRAAYKGLGLDVDYRAYDLSPAQLPAFVHGLRSSLVDGESDPWLGCSVTMPHKAAMVPFMDRVSERVRLLGVLNTVVWDPDGTAFGHNTDVDGIVRALQFAGHDAQTTGGTVAVVGGGGTAAAALAAAPGLGADAVELFLRTPCKAAGLVELAAELGLGTSVHPLQDLNERAPHCGAVVVTLPPRAADPLAAAVLEDPVGAELPPLLDVAYDPWPSALAIAWEERGGRVVSGLEMLLYQAVEQVRLFTGRPRQGTPEPDWDAIIGQMATTIGLPPR